MNVTSINQGQADGAQFAQHMIIDQQHQRIIVAAFEHPHDWQARSQVIWNFQHTSLPVAVYAATFNPNGTESLEFLPVEAYYWLEPNYGFDVVGQNKFGLTCMPPMPATDAMTRNVIPKYRGDRRNLRVVGVQQIPNLPQIINASDLQQAPTESVAVRIEYEENGRVFEEEFYGVKTLNQAPGAGSVQINWGFARVFCFRAEKGQLDRGRNLFLRIVRSARPNPQWRQLFDQIAQQLNGQFGQRIQDGYAKLQAEAQFSQQLSAYYQEQRDRQQRDIAWKIDQQKRQQEQSPHGTYTPQDAWGDALMGRTAIHDPNNQYGNYHYETGHPEYVWTDNQGSFQSTDDPNYDPNINSDRNWVLAKKVKPGN